MSVRAVVSTITGRGQHNGRIYLMRDGFLHGGLALIMKT